MAEYNPMVVDPNQQPIPMAPSQPQQVDPLTGRPLWNMPSTPSPIDMTPLPKAQRVDQPSQFRQQLATDLTKTQENVAKQQRQLGFAPSGLANFASRGTKIGNRVVAVKESEELKRTQFDAIKELTKVAGFQDEATKAVFSNVLQDKFNK
jgi:hypothetical protein